MLQLVAASEVGVTITWRRLLSATGNHAATSLRVEVAAFLFLRIGVILDLSRWSGGWASAHPLSHEVDS